MKEHLKQIITPAADTFRARNLVREYCQARILQFLQEENLFRTWIFHGGTALRFLYALPRYSEDLDFSLSYSSKISDFSRVVDIVCRAFQAETYRVEVKVSDGSNVKSSFIRFPGLLHELGLSSHYNEVFSVKIELDTIPPAGGITETTVVRRYVVLNLKHYDRASFFSGKLHAILTRAYMKGRDLYDLFWYLSDPSCPPPNIPFLNNALRQTQREAPQITDENWARIIADHLEGFDWAGAVKDVQPFIERTSDLKLLTFEHVSNLLKKWQ
jgi:predicted nucleotidyltransferase component of viral defense system